MKRIIYYFAFLIFLLVGCTTVKVTKVTSANKENAVGIRYALGKPFIKVTPNPKGDGTFDVELIYLPDENQTYAVDAKSVLTKYTMELDVDDQGILSKVDWTKNNESITSDAASAAGDIAKARLDKKQKDQEAADADAKTLNDALIQKQLDLKAAQDDSASLATAFPEASRDADTKEKIRQAQLLVGKYTRELQSIKDQMAGAGIKATGLNAAANKPVVDKAWGPVLFAIQDKMENGKEEVALTAVTWSDKSKQMGFETFVQPKSATLIEESEKAFEITLTGQPITRTLPLNISNPTIDQSQSTIRSGDGASINISKLNLLVKDKQLTMIFNKADFPKAVYSVKIKLKFKNDAGKDDEGLLALTVTVK